MGDHLGHTVEELVWIGPAHVGDGGLHALGEDQFTLTGAKGVAVQVIQPDSTVKLVPVKIHETFTPLPCAGSPSHRTTLEQEGCAEKQILRNDTQIDVLEAQIFPILFNDHARRDLNAAQHAWLTYRKADCLSMSDLFEGGTEAGVVDAQCVAARNSQRVKDLRAFHRGLTRSG